MKTKQRRFHICFALLCAFLIYASAAAELVYDTITEVVDTTENTYITIFKVGDKEIPDPKKSTFLDADYKACEEEDAKYEITGITYTEYQKINTDDTKVKVRTEEAYACTINDVEHRTRIDYYKTTDTYQRIGTVTVEEVKEKTQEKKDTYSIMVKNDGDGTASANVQHAKEGTIVSLTATPVTGYRLKEWVVESGDVEIKYDSFRLGHEDVVIKAVFEAIPRYTVTVSQKGKGQVTVSSTYAQEGTVIYLTAVAAEGYEFQGWNVVSGDVSVSGNQFTMGKKNVSLEVMFALVAPVAEKQYVVLEGANSLWTKGKGEDPTFLCDGKLENFLGLQVDGSFVNVDTTQSTAAQTVAKLAVSSWETLKDGEHQLQFVYADGKSDTITFSVVSPEEEPEPEDPTQAIITSAGIGTAILVVVTFGMVHLRKMLNKRKERNKTN